MFNSVVNEVFCNDKLKEQEKRLNFNFMRTWEPLKVFRSKSIALRRPKYIRLQVYNTFYLDFSKFFKLIN